MEKYSSILNTSSITYYSRTNEDLSWYDKNLPEIWEWLETTYQSSNYRLPMLIKPIFYDIHLKPYFEDKNFTFEGKVKIVMKVVNVTSRIILNANDLKFEEIKIFNKSGEEMIISSHTLNTTTEKLSIYLKHFVKANTELSVIFKYSGILNDNLRGFYRSSYTDDNNQTR